MDKDNKEEPPGKIKNHKLPKKVGIIYSDVKRKYFPTQAQYLSVKDSFHDARVIAKYIEKMGIKPVLYIGNSTLPAQLKKNSPDMVINLVDAIKGKEWLSSTIPALLELLDIPYTGAGILGESLVYNKFLVKKLLEQNGVPVPRYQLLNRTGDILDPTLRYPLISKLNEIHGSVEITKDAVSENEKHLRKRTEYLMSTYKQPILIEEFIVGREITAILLEGLNTKVYLAEKVFTKPEKYSFVTFEDQWVEGAPCRFYYQKFQDSLLREYIIRAFAITKMDDYGKFDVRLDSSGRYYFIDSNSNPAFGPKELDCAISNILSLYGISFIEILKRLIQNTIKDKEGNGQTN